MASINHNAADEVTDKPKPADKYTLPQRGLHWITALTVIGLFAMGLWMRDLGYYDPWYHKAPFWHKSVGLLLAAMVVIRLVLRLTQAHPPPLASHQRWEKLLARLTHIALYLLLFSAFTSGYLIATADNRPAPFFGLFDIPPLITAFEHQEDVAGEIHEICVWSLVVLAALHALAALKHHVIDRDSTLRRML
jgi:cytochrome b561